MPYAIGRTFLSGTIVYRQAHGEDNKYETIITVLSGGGPHQSIDTLYVDNVVASIGAGGTVGVSDRGKMTAAYQLGLTPEPAALSVGPAQPYGWGSDCKLSGYAATIVTLEYDAKGKTTFTTEPQVGWVGHWAKVYDPRLDSTYPGGSGAQRASNESTWTWSDNPGLHALTWLIGRHQNAKLVLGVGLALSGIIVDQFVEMANVCEANAWTIGGVVSSADDKWNVFEQMLQAGGAEPLHLGAQIGCLVNTPRVSLATISSSDVVGDGGSVQATQAIRDRLNTIIPTCRFENQGWEMAAASPVVVDDYVTFDGGQRQQPVTFGLVQCFGSADPTQVVQLARYQIENSREFGPITLPLKLRWMGYKPGDVVTATVPELGLNGQNILLLNRSLSPAGGTVTMTARSETAGKHPYALGQTGTPPPTPSVSGPPLVPTPGDSAWSITGTGLTANGSTLPAIVIAGSADSNVIDEVLFEYRVSTGTQNEDQDWISAGSEQPATTGKIITGVKAGTPYQAAVSYRRKANVGDRLILGPVMSAGHIATDTTNVGGKPVTQLALINLVPTLPASGVIGEFYLNEADGKLYTWNGTKWINATDPVTLALTNDTYSAPAQVDGSSPDLTGANGQARVFLGATEVTAAATFSKTSSGCTGTVNTADNTPVAGQPRGYFQVTAMTADTASLTISATSNGVTQKKSFTLAKSRQGNDGTDGSDGASAFTLVDNSSGNMTVAPKSITKIGGVANTWDTSAISVEGFVGGAFVSFTPTATNKRLMIGLNTDPYTDNKYTSIDYAFSLRADGTLYAYESGTGHDLATSFAAGDSLQIIYSGTSVSYVRNGTTLRTVTGLASGQMLYFDSSFADIGASATNISFGSIGAPGSSAPTLDISTSSLTFVFDGNGNPIPGNQSIALKANIQNLSGNATWAATKYDATGTSIGPATLTGAGNSKALSLSGFGSAAFVVVTATLNGITDTATIQRLTQGSDAISLVLSNEAVTLPAATDGTVSSFAPSAGQFHVYRGATDVTASCTFAIDSQTGCTIALDAASGAYSCSAMSADGAVAVLSATYGGATYEKAFTLAKSRAGAPGASAPLLTLSTTAHSFTFDGTGAASPAGQSITLAAVLQNLSSAGVVWAATGYDSGGNSLGAVTLTGGGFTIRHLPVANIGAAAYVVVTATDGTLSDQVTIPRLTAGSSALVGFLTNEAATVPAAADGTVASGDLGGAAGAFKVYLGTTDVTAQCSFARVAGTQTGMVAAIDAAAGTYATTSIAASSGKVTYRATYGTQTIDKTFTVAKSIAGQDGEDGADAQLLTLSASSDKFTFDGAGNASPSSQAVTFTAKFQNLSSSGTTWTATGYDASNASIGAVTLTGGGNTVRTLSIANFGAASRVVVTAVNGSLSDQVTVVRLQDGSHNLVGVLTNETTTFAAGSDGAVSSFTPGNGTFEVYFGTTDVTAACTFSKTAQSGVTGSISAAGAYAITAMTADTGTLTMQASYQGVTITKIATYAKSKAGATGSNAKTLYVISDRQTISYDKDGDLSPASQTTTFKAVKQNSSAAVNWTMTRIDGTSISAATYLSATSGDSVTMTAAKFDTARGSTGGVIVIGTIIDGSTISDQISVLKVQDGATGAKGDKGDDGEDGADGRSSIAYYSSTTPTTPPPVEGDIWYNPTTKSFKILQGGVWVPMLGALAAFDVVGADYIAAHVISADELVLGGVITESLADGAVSTVAKATGATKSLTSTTLSVAAQVNHTPYKAGNTVLVEVSCTLHMVGAPAGAAINFQIMQGSVSLGSGNAPAQAIAGNDWPLFFRVPATAPSGATTYKLNLSVSATGGTVAAYSPTIVVSELKK